MDASFAFDLPPASQLDTSVLDALPAALRDRILRTYSDRSRKADAELSKLPEIQPGSVQPPVLRVEEPREVVSPVAVSDDNLVHPSATSSCVIEDDSEFLSSFRVYLKDWVEHCADGPLDPDVEKVSNYLQQLSRTNLTVVLGVLRYFRRLLTQRDLPGWYPSFNLLLTAVQVEVRHEFNGTLPVRQIVL